MGLLDFMFPVIMAAEARSKLRGEKEVAEIIRKSNQKVSDLKDEENWIEENYKDFNLEMDLPFKYGRPKEEYDPEKVFVFRDFIESLPSFDADAKTEYGFTPDINNLTESFIVNGNLERLGVSIALAKFYGKLPIQRGLMPELFYVYNFRKMPNVEYGKYWGRERYDYVGQVLHEAMQEYHKYMKMHDFPYDLKVINLWDYPDDARIRRSEAIVVTEEPKYRWGHTYFWNLKTLENDILNR